MPTARSTGRRAAALIAASAIIALTAGTALAHPEAEGQHAGCVVTAEPGSVAAGGQFTVAGNFGGASIWVLPGANATVPEGAAPSATVPQGAASFSITFTALGPGELTVFAAIVDSGCGDTDHLTVTATLPNTAAETPPAGTPIAGVALLLAAVLVALRRTAASGMTL